MKTITVLDIGSFETRALLVSPSSKDGPQVLGVGKKASKGIKKGVVIDINEASQTVSEVLEMVQNTSGLKVASLLVAVNGTSLSSTNTKGIVAVSRADREITQSDVERAIRSAQATVASPNREIVSILPRGFSIDNEEGIRNPIGMNGIRLEADTVIISASTPFLRNLSKAITLGGWKVSELIPGPMVCGETLVSKKSKDLGTAVLDIGSDTMSLTVYEDGEILFIEMLSAGGSLVTSDIAIGIRIDIDSAERIKIKYGTVIPERVRKTEIIDLHPLGLEDNVRVRRYEVAQIIEARMRELLRLASKSLEKIGKRNFLPAGVVLAGGGAKLEGMAELAKEEFKLPVRVGFPAEFRGLVDEIVDPGFAKVAGLAMWKIHQLAASPEKDETYGDKIRFWFGDIFERILP